MIHRELLPSKTIHCTSGRAKKDLRHLHGRRCHHLQRKAGRSLRLPGVNGAGKTTAIKMLIVIEIQMVFNPLLVSAYNFIPGVVAIILLLISAMMASLTIAKEKETGTMDLLLVNPLVIILGKVTPYVAA